MRRPTLSDIEFVFLSVLVVISALVCLQSLINMIRDALYGP